MLVDALTLSLELEGPICQSILMRDIDSDEGPINKTTIDSAVSMSEHVHSPVPSYRSILTSTPSCDDSRKTSLYFHGVLSVVWCFDTP